MDKKINYMDIDYANSFIKKTDIKGKDYAEVNQRIKAFRMVYPEGTIETEMVSLQDGIVIFKATISDGYNLLATGTAYEKENSTFINKTSYIENCETSAVGRALGMCGFGIDASVASAEEVQNTIINQMESITIEDAKEYRFESGKHENELLTEVIELDPSYIDWILNKCEKPNPAVVKMITLLTGEEPKTEEEKDEHLDMTKELMELIVKYDVDLDAVLETFKVDDINKLNNKQYKKCIEHIKKKYEVDENGSKNVK